MEGVEPTWETGRKRPSFPDGVTGQRERQQYAWNAECKAEAPDPRALKHGGLPSGAER